MKKIKKYLKKHLTKERYQHTIGVAYTAVSKPKVLSMKQISLSMVFGIPITLMFNP